jgi:hypothetical protein
MLKDGVMVVLVLRHPTCASGNATAILKIHTIIVKELNRMLIKGGLPKGVLMVATRCDELRDA